MMAIMILTWTAWFLCSAGLLWLGLDSMALRYPLAVGIAYLAFLGMLWAWLRVMISGKEREAALPGVPTVTLGTGLAAWCQVRWRLPGVCQPSSWFRRIGNPRGSERGPETDPSFLELGDMGDLGGGSDAGGVVLILALVGVLDAS